MVRRVRSIFLVAAVGMTTTILSGSVPPPSGEPSSHTNLAGAVNTTENTAATPVSTTDADGSREQDGAKQSHHPPQVSAGPDHTIRLPQDSVILAATATNEVTITVKPKPRPMPPSNLRIRFVK